MWDGEMAKTYPFQLDPFQATAVACIVRFFQTLHFFFNSVTLLMGSSPLSLSRNPYSLVPQNQYSSPLHLLSISVHRSAMRTF